MNILYHHRTQASNAEGVHIRELIRALRENGHTVQAVSPPGISLADPARHPRGRSRWRWVTRYLPQPLFELMELLYNYSGYRRCAAACRGKEVDLVYERFAFFCRVGLKIARRLNAPLFLEVNYTTMTPLYRRKSKLLLWLARRIERRCFQEAAALFVVSSYLKEQLMGMGIPASRIFLTPNAVDERVFGRQADGTGVRSVHGLEGKTVIGYVGAFFPWHGLDFLLETVRALEAERDHMAVFLVGRGPMESQLRSAAARMNMRTPLVFAGTVAYGQLPEYIAAMDICVLPDSNNYGSPMKLFEYMAAGRPVVAPCLGPVLDVVTDGVNGLVFTKRDRAAFGAALERLMDDASLRARIGEAARRTISGAHYWKHNAQTVLKALRGRREGGRESGQ